MSTTYIGVSDVNCIDRVFRRYYNDGFEEGLNDGQQAGLLEGKQFGIQTAFQRFLSVGIVQGRVDVWTQKAEPGGDGGGNGRMAKHLNQLSTTISEIPQSNSDQDVADFEKLLKKARAKLKVVSSLGKDDFPVNLYETGSISLQSTEEVIEDMK